MFSAPTGNKYGASFYGTAAVSNTLGGDYWMSEACGKCWRLKANGNVNGIWNRSTIVVKGTNFCPTDNSACNNKDHFDIAAPGFDFSGASLSNSCETTEAGEFALYPPQTCGNWMISSQDPNANCDCDAIND